MHGTLLFLFATWLCFTDRSNPYSLSGALGPVRYFLLMMGFFSIYCGFIYNDFSSLPVMLFGDGCYDKLEKSTTSDVYYAYKTDQECVQPFGMDPIWYRSEAAEIIFMNSFKMKTSVILGVAQMMLGTCLKGFNAIYFGRYIEFIFEVVTQIILISALFGFMDMMIIVKWLTNWASDDIPASEGPPGIITTMITMFIDGGVKKPENTDADVIGDQTSIMQVLVKVALVCVPLMLLVKPILKSRKPKPVVEDRVREGLMDQPGPFVKEVMGLLGVEDKGPAHHPFSELIIHQLIETIEYCIGTVSNTASYLRLWALSLAHSQLAKVFFDYTLAGGLKGGSYPAVSSNHSYLNFV